jgi:hypothetical protein
MALLQKAQQSSKQVQDETAGPVGGAPNASNGAPSGNTGGEGRGRGNTYRRRQLAADGVQAAREANIELVNVLIEALEKEHECLYQSIVQPVIAYVNEVLPEPSRASAEAAAKPPELAFEDLEKLTPDDAAHVVEWLTEKVDALSTKLKADPKEEEEVRGGLSGHLLGFFPICFDSHQTAYCVVRLIVSECVPFVFLLPQAILRPDPCLPLQEEEEESMGDVDLWSLVDDGKALTVNEKWLQHLQVALLIRA